MEQDKNPFPEIKIISPAETFRKVADFLATLVRLFPLEAPAYMSNHYHENTGAAPALDRALYDTPATNPNEKHCVLGIIPTSEWR